MLKMELIKLNPTKIIVKEGLDRYRKDMGAIKDLMLSIISKGQLQPIIITREFELIDGGRRLAACLLAEIPIYAIYKDDITDTKLRELELESNLQRKDFTPAELALAIRDFHSLKQKEHGSSTSGREGGWTLQKTATVLGKTPGYITQQTQIAHIVEVYPELKNCKTVSEIDKAAKALYKILEREQAVKKFEKDYTSIDLNSIIIESDALALLRSLPDESFDLVISDPPYSINIDEISISGGISGGMPATGFKYEDTLDPRYLRFVLTELNRVLRRDNGMIYLFCSFEQFNYISLILRDKGWKVYFRPLIWVKNQGTCNNPNLQPYPRYENILFARREKARLKSPISDVLDYSDVSPTEKLHPSQKPLELIDRLIDSVALPGMALLDPFCGSGVVIRAGLKAKLKVLGCDSLKEAILCAKENLVDFIQSALKETNNVS